jgi:hypothetical protein
MGHMAFIFTEGVSVMDTRMTLAARMQTHIARLLAKGPASPLILTGTLAFAGLGGAALQPRPGSQQPHAVIGAGRQMPTYPSGQCRPDPDGDGHILCYLDSSQVAAYPDGHCFANPDGDGHFMCYFDGDGQ